MKKRAILIFTIFFFSCLAGCTPNQARQDSTLPVTVSPASAPLVQAVPTPKDQPSLPGFQEAEPAYEVVFSLPVGESGAEYKGAGIPDASIEGPSALGVFFDNTFAIADPACMCLLRFSPSGELMNYVSLASVNIHMLSDMAVLGEDFLVLEAGFGPAPEIYRVFRVSPEGELRDSFDLPDWARLETGLSGIHTWPGGEVLLEMEGGSKSYLLMNAAGMHMAGQEVGRYDLSAQPTGELVWKDPAGARMYTIRSEFTYANGSLTVLSANLDGSFFVLRTDVVDDSIIQVDQTIHWLDPNGAQLGLARFPLAESYYYVSSSLAVGADASVYALIPRANQVDIVRLLFYEQLAPLTPIASPPVLQVELYP